MSHIAKYLKNLRHPLGIAGLLIAFLIPFTIYLAPNMGQKDAIQALDLYLPFWLFLVQFILGFALFVGLFKDAKVWILEHLPEKRILILMAIIATVMTAFAATQIEARHRVQSDESVFLSVAQNLYHNQISGTCNEGEFENGDLHCLNNTNSFKTKGLAVIYLLGMPLFGSELHWIFTLELFFLFFSILFFFFAIKAWTGDNFLSITASVLLAAQPTLLFQFRSASVEPLYVLLSAVSLWMLKWVMDRNTVRHWVLFGLVLAFFAQTRQETIFCLLAFIVFATPKLLDRPDKKAPAFLITLSFFSIPVLLTISYFQGYNFQGGQFSAHGHFLENLTRNWDVMTTSMTGNLLTNPFLSSFNYLFIIGLIILILKATKELYHKEPGFSTYSLLFLALYHIQTYAILENVSGDFTIEINQRYSLVMFPSMAFLGAIAIQTILYAIIKGLGFVNLRENKSMDFFFAILVAVAIIANTFSYKESFNNNIMYNKNHLTIEEVTIWNWLSKQEKKDRLFIYGRPWHFVGYGVSSIHYDRARAMEVPELQALLEKYKGEVYYIRGLDCWDSKTYHQKAVEHRIPTTCDVFERETQMEDVTQILITNNYWLRIAKLKNKRIYDPEKLFEFGFWQGTPEKQEVIVGYVMPFAAAAEPWKVTLLLNEQAVKTMPYESTRRSDTLSGYTLKPGYNKFEALIQDSTTQEVISKTTNFRFFRFDGALQLNEFAVKSNRQGWGDLQVNKSVDGHQFHIQGKSFEEGFGTHAPSEITFDVRKEFKHLSALVGLDDESLCSDGVKIRVIGDGSVLFEIPKIVPQELMSIEVDIPGVQILSIESDALQTNNCDHVDIVNPTLLPIAIKKPL